MSSAPVEARLHALRAETEAELRAAGERIDAMTAARADANADDEHDPEGATIGFEWSQADALRGGLRQRLAEIDAALTRIADGTDGVCAVCGEPIAPGRLEARPTTDRCIRHA
ncbi:TraR/DksA family transcriptional regulator [Amnibacterium kyonggiense]|uniref:TraR/DksA family transcriptional regulator n=1 Tax=Amnibacterium kyonggiense TaxID=595671 RepID=A0A4R7FRZ8_9MICO|nr:TraR/DksA C4-type zinc finger protein [Amnibacterium kyonggiense]TDS80593.1 TraR/DksA family transcriptional regulator [Amnibacterium kyonggiense]